VSVSGPEFPRLRTAGTRLRALCARARTAVAFGETPRSFLLLAVVFVVSLSYPVAAFLARAGGLSAGAFADPVLLSAARYSLATAPVATLLASGFGVPLAYVLARASFPGKLAVEALVALPLVVPPVVAGVMLVTGVGHGSTVGTLASAAGLPLTDSYLGIVLAQTFVAGPFLIVTARAGFAGVDERLEEASRTLGRGRWATFRRVTLPLARGHVLAGIALTFARAVGEFGATMLTAYTPHTLPTQIWVAFLSRGVTATIPFVVLLLVIGGAVVVAVQASGRGLWQ
jgi:molybdate/tungstate transport system permease protein